MHALGIPTTRALAVVATGRPVRRETLLPGAVLTRVASSHLRVGSFQYARATGDSDLLRRLADHAIARHYPGAAQADHPCLALFEAVVAAQASLVAQWMLVGFVHGVMNTDNMTISGETIDYGPCAFMEAYDPATVYSSIDAGGRYAYGNQPVVTEWNLARLAEALLPLLHDDQDEAIALAVESLGGFRRQYDAARSAGMRAKLGLPEDLDEAVASALVEELLTLLQHNHVDHTSFFRGLGAAARGGTGPSRAIGSPISTALRRAISRRTRRRPMPPSPPASCSSRTETPCWPRRDQSSRRRDRGRDRLLRPRGAQHEPGQPVR